MADPKTDAYRAAVTSCVLAAQLLATLDLPAFLEANKRAEFDGVVLSPTLYPEEYDALLEDKAVLRRVSLRAQRRSEDGRSALLLRCHGRQSTHLLIVRSNSE